MHDARHDTQLAPAAPALAPAAPAPAFETPHADLRDALLGEAGGPWYDALRQEVAERDGGVDRSVSTASNAYRLDRMTGGSESVPEAVAARLAGRTHTDPAERDAARAQLGAMAELLGSKPFIGLDDPLEHEDPRAVREPREHGRRKAKNKRAKRAEEMREEQETARAEEKQARAQEGVEEAAKAGTSEVGGALAAAPGVSAPVPAVPQPAPAPAPAPSPRAAPRQAGDALGAQDFAPGLAAVPGAGASALAVQAAPAAPAAPDGDLARAFMNHHWDSSHWEAIRAEAGVLREEESIFVERALGRQIGEGRIRDAVLSGIGVRQEVADAAWGLLPLPPNPFRLVESLEGRWDLATSQHAALAEVNPALAEAFWGHMQERALYGMLADGADAVDEAATALDVLAAVGIGLGMSAGSAAGSSAGAVGSAVGAAAGTLSAAGLISAWSMISPFVHACAPVISKGASLYGALLDVKIGIAMAAISLRARREGRVLEQDVASQIAAERLQLALDATFGLAWGEMFSAAWKQAPISVSTGTERGHVRFAADTMRDGAEGTRKGAVKKVVELGNETRWDVSVWLHSDLAGAVDNALIEMGSALGTVSDLRDKGVRFTPRMLVHGAGLGASLQGARADTNAKIAGHGAALRAAPDPVWTPRGLAAARAELDAGIWREGSYLSDAATTAAWLADQGERLAANEVLQRATLRQEMSSDAERALWLAAAISHADSHRLREAEGQLASIAMSEGAAARVAAGLEDVAGGMLQTRERVQSLFDRLPAPLQTLAGPGLYGFLSLVELHEVALAHTGIAGAYAASGLAAQARAWLEAEVARLRERSEASTVRFAEAQAIARLSLDDNKVPSGVEVKAAQLRSVASLLRAESAASTARRRALRARVEDEAPAEIESWVGAFAQVVEDYFLPEAPEGEIDAIGEVFEALRDENLLNADDHDEARALRAAAESEVGKIGQAAVARVWAIGDRVAELADQAEARDGASGPDAVSGTTTP